MAYRSVIGTARRRFWDDYGFLVFRGFFSDEEVDAVRSAYDRTWESVPPWVVVDDLVTNRRCRMSDLSEAERRHNFKVNDLYMLEPDIRSVALSERVGLVLEELLGDEPTICNTLNFDKGSQQSDHLDTLYMTPISRVGLVATWMALEDAEADAGPLRYYPGSNHIEPYFFSTGSMHQYDPEVPQWADYMATQVEKLGLGEQRFMAKRGDLFIWHALLLHGGSQIRNPGLTRQSLVTHFWTQSDCETLAWDLRPAPGGWWIKKTPLSVPGEPEAVRVPPDAYHLEKDEPNVLAGLDVKPERELRERLADREATSSALSSAGGKIVDVA